MKKLVGPSSPSSAWQSLARPWAVLPIGATEQHGPHLPLNTDLLEAEYFAEKLALDLEAGLLPAIPVFTSMEQGGFRGSLTLGLETAIAMIKDLIEELEKQNFTRLILLNFHGGNHVLKPIAKDVNRKSRPLKVLLLNAYEYDTSDEGRAFGRFDIHAGAWETSLMLALHPDLVGDYKTVESPAEIEGAVQDDLAHFGMGTLRPAGVWGNPKAASVEAGRAIAASLERNLLEAAKKRLAWFDEKPIYNGTDGVAVRVMKPWDVPAGLGLCREAGWNQSEEDWMLFLDLDPEGCFVAQRNGKVIGTVTSTNFGNDLGRIAMLLVDSRNRRQGIGRLLMEKALEHLAPCPSVQLDATVDGKPLYEGLGFAGAAVFTRLLRPAESPLPETPACRVRPFEAADLEAAAALDAEAFGTSRAKMIELLYKGAQAGAFAALDRDGKLAGFCLGKPGTNFDRIGPLQARSEEAARALVAAALGALKGKPAGVDIPPGRDAWRAWLEEIGFRFYKENVRMVLRGELPERQDLTYATTGAALG